MGYIVSYVDQNSTPKMEVQECRANTPIRQQLPRMNHVVPHQLPHAHLSHA